MSFEQIRLRDHYRGDKPWLRWGPYLSERQWGTVREDYSSDGKTWEYLPHDHARSRAYRWGEDGILGISDDRQLLCFAMSFWNGQDEILKERLFGLSNAEGNHGEDCKEYYYYLESTPTHSYMKGLYKYPQQAYPYDKLVQGNASRGKQELEYELIDTGIFDDDRYFDISVEYAKADVDDILIQITVANRGSEWATLHLLPTLWFRNVWSWGGKLDKPVLERVDGPDGVACARAQHAGLPEMTLYCEGSPQLLFVENETNTERLYGHPNVSPFVKDGIDRFVVHGDEAAVNPHSLGTKVASHYSLSVAPTSQEVVRLRLASQRDLSQSPLGDEFSSVFQTRKDEADEFYGLVIPEECTDDEKSTMRQAAAGLMWTKQFYNFDVQDWLDNRGESNRRNADWNHMKGHDIISMPDKWEYPWFAVWDSAFHCIALKLVDINFAKQQLSLFLEDRYQRADGAIPAYEWNFSDVNPPVHAWATLELYGYDKSCRADGDLEYLKWMHARLKENFQWWINQEGVHGRNVFEGGFLGLDNIGVFDRSAELPTGGHLEQSDGTAWMVLYSQIMFRMSLELSKSDAAYEDDALYFFDCVLKISSAKIDNGHTTLWDEEDGFFYDVLCFPDGHSTRLKVRSLVGLLPLAAVTVVEEETLARLPQLAQRLAEVYDGSGITNIHCPRTPGMRNRRMLAVLDEDKLRRVLSRMLDESEFFSPHGIRSVSKFHEAHPYIFHWEGREHRVKYTPADSDSYMFGGNSNWRGPVWIPMNYILVRALVNLYMFYGDEFTVECPTGSGNMMTLYEVSEELSRRLVSIFQRNERGHRPVYGGAEKFQSDPNWRDHILFYEYFHGDSGAGIGASHQTGWTACVAALINYLRRLDGDSLLNASRSELAAKLMGGSCPLP